MKFRRNVIRLENVEMSTAARNAHIQYAAAKTANIRMFGRRELVSADSRIYDDAAEKLADRRLSSSDHVR